MRLAKNLALILGTIVSLYWLVQFFSVGSLLLLVPWDVSIVRPEVGTWQRTLNDFFESRTGEIITYSFYSLFFATNILYTLRKRWQSALPIIITNLIATLSLFLLVAASFPIAQFFLPFGQDPTDPFHDNYARNLLPMALTVIVLVLWVRELLRLQNPPIKAKNKAKHERLTQKPNIRRLIETHAISTQDEMRAITQSTKTNHL